MSTFVMFMFLSNYFVHLWTFMAHFISCQFHGFPGPSSLRHFWFRYRWYSLFIISSYPWHNNLHSDDMSIMHIVFILFLAQSSISAHWVFPCLLEKLRFYLFCYFKNISSFNPHHSSHFNANTNSHHQNPHFLRFYQLFFIFVPRSIK